MHIKARIVGSFVTIAISIFFVILMSILLNSSTTSRPGLYVAILLFSLAAGISGCIQLKRYYPRYIGRSSQVEIKKMRVLLTTIGSLILIAVSLFFIVMMIVVLFSNPSHPGTDIAIMIFFLATGVWAVFLLKNNASRKNSRH